MEFLTEYGMFLAQTLTIVMAFLMVVIGIALVVAHNQQRFQAHFEIQHLNQHYDDAALTLNAVLLPKKALKAQKKQIKAAEKIDKSQRRRLFVLNFAGDLRASATAALREEVTAVLKAARPDDEVLVRLESAGGLVQSYGLAASQLLRLRERRLKLTVAVDKVAASGGYLMACVADHIIAAPFAIVGSIGVVSQLPNFNRLLRKHDVDFEQFTAGEYKRTVTLFGENTEQGRNKFQQELDDLHELFKTFVKEHRSQVDIAQVATGEFWFGLRALNCRLVDELRTSDDYLLAASEAAELFEIKYITKKPLMERFLSRGADLLARLSAGNG